MVYFSLVETYLGSKAPDISMATGNLDIIPPLSKNHNSTTKKILLT